MISLQESLIKRDTLVQITRDFIVEFEINNKVAMFVEVNDKGDSSLYRLFTEEKTYKYSDLSYKKTTPSGHISFLELNNFPDGLFLEKKGENHLVFHIVELKLNPLTDYSRLSNQLMCGYLHCKAIADILEFNTTADYHFYVGYSKTHTENAIYNRNHKAKRFLVGQNSVDVKEPETTKWSLWLNSEINFKLSDFEKKINFNKVALTTWENITPQDINYDHIYADCEFK